MSGRNPFEAYFFEGGFEADAKLGVAQAIAKLKAAGIDPTTAQTVKKPTAVITPLNHRHHPELVKAAAAMPPEIIAGKSALSRGVGR